MWWESWLLQATSVTELKLTCAGLFFLYPARALAFGRAGGGLYLVTRLLRMTSPSPGAFSTILRSNLSFLDTDFPDSWFLQKYDLTPEP